MPRGETVFTTGKINVTQTVKQIHNYFKENEESDTSLSRLLITCGCLLRTLDSYKTLPTQHFTSWTLQSS